MQIAVRDRLSPASRVVTRSRTRLAVWLVAFLILYTALAWTIDDTCVSSQTVQLGQTAVTNPTTCE